MAADSPAASSSRPARSLAIVYACMAGVLVLVGLAAVVVVPAWQTRAVVAGHVGGRLSAPAALDQLGGPGPAMRRLSTYLAHPGWAAPEKPAAVRLLAACGEAAVPALVLALDPRRVRAAGERLVRLEAIALAGPALLPAVLAGAAARESDGSVLSVELLLLGLCRKPETAELLAGFLDDRRPEVRAAAADALGILHRPAYPIPLASAFPYNQLENVPVVKSDPSVRVRELVALSHYGGRIPTGTRNYDEPLNQDEIALPEELRRKLEAVMLGGGTPAEREAAARALVRWPPKGYRLRVAEWGVWLADLGEVKLVQSVLDEIPPFVHRTGNPAGSFSDRVNHVIMITKPIVHLTASCPLAVDLEVNIRHGRPWFAYPLPDDFSLDVATQYGPWKAEDAAAFAKLKTLDHLDNPDLPELKDLGEGYPWLEPRHRRYGALSGSMGSTRNPILGLGLRWQSLIVSPERLPWMKPPAVPEDPKFQWWGRLRQVGASWLAGRGEAERFLYYDGPTLARAPVAVKLRNGELAFTPQETFPSADGVTYSRDRNPEGSPAIPAPPDEKAPVARKGIFIEVAGGVAGGRVVELPAKGGPAPPAADAGLRGAEVRAALRKLLTDSGLTGEEAEGLLDCWAGQFFRAEGRRFLTVLAARDYDAMCPLAISPAPTALVRVGLLLTEFPR